MLRLKHLLCTRTPTVLACLQRYSGWRALPKPPWLDAVETLRKGNWSRDQPRELADKGGKNIGEYSQKGQEESAILLEKVLAVVAAHLCRLLWSLSVFVCVWKGAFTKQSCEED